MLKEIKVYTDMYKNVDGESVMIAEDVVTKYVLDTDNLIGPFEIISPHTLKPYKRKCRVIHPDVGNMMIKHSYNEVKEWKIPKTVGFKKLKNS